MWRILCGADLPCTVASERRRANPHHTRSATLSARRLQKSTTDSGRLSSRVFQLISQNGNCTQYSAWCITEPRLILQWTWLVRYWDGEVAQWCAWLSCPGRWPVGIMQTAVSRA